jgi:WD40 repeat protein
VNAKWISSSAVCICLLAATSMATEPPITSIVFDPDGKSVVACSQSGLQVFNWPAMQLQKTLKTSAPNLHDAAFSPTGDRLAVAGGTPAEEGTVEILSWPDGKSLWVLDDHDDSVMAVAWRDDTTVASASLDHSVIVWNTEANEKVRSLKGHSRGVSSLCFLKDKRTLVSAGIDQSLRVWNPDSGELVRSLSIHTMPIHDISLRPGDHGLPVVASASEDRTVRLWQPTIGRMVRFSKLKSKPLAAEWLPDGSRIVVSCTDGHVRLINPETAEVTQDIQAVDGWAYSLAVHSTDGTILVGGSNGQLRRIKPNAAN